MHYLPTNEASSFKESALDEHASRHLANWLIGHFESFLSTETISTCFCTRYFRKDVQYHFHLIGASTVSLVWIPESATLNKAKL